MIEVKKILVFIFIPLIIAGCMNTSPEQQAGEVVRSNLRSPSSFKYVDGEVLWSGNTINGDKAYVVAVAYDAQNGFGAMLRGCAMVAYFVADNGQLRWDNISGFQEMPNSLQGMCNRNIPLEPKIKYASDIASINKFTKSEIKNKNSKSSQEATSVQYESKSNSKEFSGAKLGGKIRDYMSGESLQIDGGPYFFTKNKALLSYELDDGFDRWKDGELGKITFITFNCKEVLFPKSIGNASIDGISCTSPISKVESSGWDKLCAVYHFESYEKPFNVIYLKGNSFIQVKREKNSSSEITELGLYLNKGTFNKAYKDCDKAEEMKIKAKNQGYKTLGDMLVQESKD